MNFDTWTEILVPGVKRLYFEPRFANNFTEVTNYVQVLNFPYVINLITNLNGQVIARKFTNFSSFANFTPEIFLNSFVYGQTINENYCITFANFDNNSDTNVYYFTNVTDPLDCSTVNISTHPTALFAYKVNEVIIKGTGINTFKLMQIFNNNIRTLRDITEHPPIANITAISAYYDNNNNVQLVCVNATDIFFGTFNENTLTITWSENISLLNFLGRSSSNCNLFTFRFREVPNNGGNKIILFGNQTTTNFLIIKKINNLSPAIILQKSYRPVFYVAADDNMIMFVVGGTGENDCLEVIIFDNDLNQIYSHTFSSILASSVNSAICIFVGNDSNQLFLFVNFNDANKDTLTLTTTYSICLLPDCDVLLSNLTYKNITQITLDDSILGAISQQPQKILKIYKHSHTLTSLPETNQPFLIKKNNFTDNVPDKDIHISGHHRIIIKNKDDTFTGIQAYKLITKNKNEKKENDDEEETTVDYYHLVLENKSEGFIVNGLRVESCQN
jgi:hypothetical protein